MILLKEFQFELLSRDIFLFFTVFTFQEYYEVALDQLKVDLRSCVSISSSASLGERSIEQNHIIKCKEVLSSLPRP